ncbi:hypothetical protein SBOR_8180 [Sclerotinia borealis F-4128]|uniref:Uncharacterized protein n=1 Tax=Sclerotinia borealis (strain F-4128) TaxID=1432307 RepID=W9C3Y3_SCLBF|nr:hypothetical protein SBOR_8180 [Sclerotinia borealis F-4128]
MRVPFATVLLPLFFSVSAKTVLDVEPIYIGEVFDPPAMYFLAWTSSTPSTSKEVGESTTSHTPEWCRSAIDISNSANFSITHPQFTGGNLTNLRFHNYFSEDAYIDRNGEKWGECYVTPESKYIGGCGNSDRWFGWGKLTWSCWPVIEDVKHHHIMRYEDEDEEMDIGTMSLSVGSGYTGAMKRSGRIQETGKPRGSEVKEAFTAVMTGSNY